MSIRRYLATAILILLLSLGGCAFVTIPLFPEPQTLQEQILEGEGKDKILILHVLGIISENNDSGPSFKREPSMIEGIKEALNRARRDNAVKGLILRINSPGGSVTTSDILYHELIEFKNTKGVKIIACFMDLGTSGGYYVATVADEIIAHPTTITGSLSVIAMKFNVKGLLDLVGIKEETIKSGELKDIWSPFRPSSDEERRIMQSIIDSFHQRFLNVIADGRKHMTYQEIVRLADGRISSADQALEAKLIDRIGYMDDAIERMKCLLGIRTATVITYARPGTYAETIYSGTSPSLHHIPHHISLDRGLFLSPPKVRMMYLWVP